MSLSLILPSFPYFHALFTCLHHPPFSLIASTCTIHCFLPSCNTLVTFPFSSNVPRLSLSCFCHRSFLLLFFPHLSSPLLPTDVSIPVVARSTPASTVLWKSVRFFIINIFFMIKNTFQVEIWPKSSLSDLEN